MQATLEAGRALTLKVYAVGKKKKTAVSGTHSLPMPREPGAAGRRAFRFPALPRTLAVGEYQIAVTFTETRDGAALALAGTFGDDGSQLDDAELSLERSFVLRVVPGPPAAVAVKGRQVFQLCFSKSVLDAGKGGGGGGGRGGGGCSRIVSFLFFICASAPNQRALNTSRPVCAGSVGATARRHDGK